MGSSNEVVATSHELLGAQAQIWNHIFQFINSMSLKCAVQLGIADVIHNHSQPISLSELIAGLNVHPSKAHFVSRLMRILVQSDIFAQHHHVHHDRDDVVEEEAVVLYSLTPASRLLLKDGPFNTTPFLLMILDPVVTTPLHLMGAWLKINDGDDPAATCTPFEMENGMPFWELGAQEPRFGNLFNEAMEADSKLIGRVVVEECGGVFEGLKSLMDVGGGSGTMAKAISNAFPNINCTVFDQPHVVAGLQGTTHNLGFMGGDMFEEIPPANAILLKSILHDWNDEESVTILKKCREAISESKNEGGNKKIIIIDIVVGYVDNKKKMMDKKSIETQLMFDMLMMSIVPGKERSKSEWEKIFFAAGFTHYNITHTLGLRSLIEVYP